VYQLMSAQPNGMHLIIILSASRPLASTSDFAEIRLVF